MKNYLAFDMGATSLRAYLGSYNSKTLKVVELERFTNEMLYLDGHYYWDILAIFKALMQSISKACANHKITSLALDTWGVDFVLFKDGQLLCNPLAYRNAFNNEGLKALLQKSKAEELYELSGLVPSPINSVSQLEALNLCHPHLNQTADHFMMIADYLNYLLTGKMFSEESIASTTALLNPHKREWSKELLELIGMKETTFCPIVPMASPLGVIQNSLKEQFNLNQSPQVVAVASHDTQCALVASNLTNQSLFLSCGTWSIMGLEAEQPFTQKEALEKGFSNEAFYGGKTAFLKNICGLWILEELFKEWRETEPSLTYGKLVELALQAKPFSAFINVDDERFASPHNMAQKITQYLQETGQPTLNQQGELTRLVLESLAFKYKNTLEELQQLTGQTYTQIFMVGGGINNRLLCQLTADICEVKLETGSNEATVYGNLALQLLASGEVENLQQARQVVFRSYRSTVFQPKPLPQLNSIFNKYKEILLC